MSSTKLKEIKTILITGGTGMVGTALSELLTANGYTITHLSRTPTQKKYKTFYWDVKKGEIEDEAITTADAIIHLAGAGVADKRWSDTRKQEIYDSRILSTRLLKQKVEALNPDLTYFLSASAIGYYGWDTGDQLVDESTAKGQGFLADVVEDWENEALKFEEINIPTGVVRIGIVLSDQGGALVEMSKPVKFGFGAPLGDGKQYMSWIHLEDLCDIFKFMLEKQVPTIINGVSPHPATNQEFTKQIAKVLKKPLWLPNVPNFALRLIVGEMADILIGGNRVSSQKIEDMGFNFKYPMLDQSLQHLLP